MNSFAVSFIKVNIIGKKKLIDIIKHRVFLVEKSELISFTSEYEQSHILVEVARTQNIFHTFLKHFFTDFIIIITIVIHNCVSNMKVEVQ